MECPFNFRIDHYPKAAIYSNTFHLIPEISSPGFPAFSFNDSNRDEKAATAVPACPRLSHTLSMTPIGMRRQQPFSTNEYAKVDLVAFNDSNRDEKAATQPFPLAELYQRAFNDSNTDEKAAKPLLYTICKLLSMTEKILIMQGRDLGRQAEKW
jgi:hypothetical protein